MEAELTEALEKESKGERFSLIEFPLLPETPIKPNRLAILLLGIVLSFAGGIGNIAIRESMDNTVRGTKGVFAIIQVPPLAVIPYIENDHDRHRRVVRRVLILLMALITLTAVSLAIHYLFMPLDILWDAVLRKLGIEPTG